LGNVELTTSGTKVLNVPWHAPAAGANAGGVGTHFPGIPNGTYGGQTIGVPFELNVPSDLLHSNIISPTCCPKLIEF